MANTPAINTHEDSDNNSPDSQLKLLIIPVFVLASPITALAAAAVYLLFSYARIKRSVIATFASPILIAPLFFLQTALNNFTLSWSEGFPTLLSSEDKLPVAMQMLGQQFWIAAPLGILLGLGIASWRWFTRARWQERTFRRTPWEIFATKRTIEKIRNDEDTPTDGMTLGVDKNSSDRVVQTYDEASGQTFLVGGSGSGKTRTALTRIRDQIKNGDGVAIVDLKADPELVNIIKIYCDRYGRKMQHFTLQDIGEPYIGPAEGGPAHYDPLSQGGHTRLADMVLDLRDWTNAEYYKKLTQSYLQLLFTVHINNPPKEGKSALEDAIELMNPKYLQERARPLAANPRFSSFVSSIDALNDERMSSDVRSNLQTNRSQLEIFLQSVAGPWLTHDKGGNNISLVDSARNGTVVVFSLDSQAYPTLSADIANLIIQDLKTVSSELLKNPIERPFHVFIDEFSAIGSENIVGLINKARASNMFVTIATQTLGDLVVKNPALRLQIMGIISSFIIHRSNTEEDSIVYAGLTGTTTVSKIRQSVDYSQNVFGGLGVGVGTGNASVEEVEQWRVMPSQIQALNVGEMYYINTSKHRIKNVQCIIEDLADPKKGGTAANSDLNSSPKNLNKSSNTEVNEPETTEQAPSLAELLAKQEENTSSSTFSPVNQQLTNKFPISKEKTHRKENPNMLFSKNNKPDTSTQQAKTANAKQATVKEALDEMTKVEVNYDLLRTFFNDPSLVDEQEQEDIADGIAADPNEAPFVQNETKPSTPSSSPPPISKPAPVSPFAPKQGTPKAPIRPSLPVSRPQPKPVTPPSKSEFEF